MTAHVGVAVLQPIFMLVLVGVLRSGRELRHFGLRVHVGMRQPVVVIAAVNVGMIARAVRIRIAMRRRACMAVVRGVMMRVVVVRGMVRVLLIPRGARGYWHVHFQSCMFQVTG